MKRTQKHVAATLIDHLEGANAAKVKKTAEELVAHLASVRQLPRLRGIVEAIEGAWKQKYGAATVTIATAHPMTETLRKKVVALAPGADIREVVDEALIGGAKVKIDDRVVDGTIDAHLKRLQTQFGN